MPPLSSESKNKLRNHTEAHPTYLLHWMSLFTLLVSLCRPTPEYFLLLHFDVIIRRAIAVIRHILRVVTTSLNKLQINWSLFCLVSDNPFQTWIDQTFPLAPYPHTCAGIVKAFLNNLNMEAIRRSVTSSSLLSTGLRNLQHSVPQTTLETYYHGWMLPVVLTARRVQWRATGEFRRKWGSKPSRLFRLISR